MSKEIEKEKKDEGPKERNIGLILVLLVLTAIVPLGFRMYSSYLQKRMAFLEKKAEKKRLVREIKKIEKQNEELEEKKKHLQTKEGIEKVARDKLGLTRPGETPFIVIQERAEGKPAAPIKRNSDKKRQKDSKEKLTGPGRD